MVHAHYKARLYTKRRHAITAVITLMLPICALFVFGEVTQINIVDLWVTLTESFLRLSAAYAVALFLGGGLAIYLGSRAWAENVLPIFDVLQNLPSFALIPIFALFFGYTNSMAVAFAVTAIVWPIFFYVLGSIRTARRDLNEAAIVFGAIGKKRILNYYLPLSFPALLTGSIVGVSIGWEAIIGIELIGKMTGIGAFIDSASSSGNNAALWAGVIGILVLVYMVNKVIWAPLVKYTEHYAE